jgi:hypothetical protein
MSEIKLGMDVFRRSGITAKYKKETGFLVQISIQELPLNLHSVF